MLRIVDRTRIFSLTTKIALTVIVASVTAVFIVAVLSFQREQESFRSALQQQAESLLTVLAETSDNALYELDVDTIELLTAGTVTTEGIQAVRFYDADGRRIADSDTPNVLTFSTSIDQAGTALLAADSIILEWHDGYLFAGQRVELGNQVPGAVAIELSTEILQKNIADARTQAILLGASVTAFAALLAFVLSQSIIRPLRRLSEAAEKVSQGHYEQTVEVYTRDELATLADAFNSMTRSIQQTTADLRAARDDAVASQQLAQENSRLKSEFLSTMSHELRTPLNAIEGFTSIMLSGMGIELSPRATEMVRRVSSNSKRLLNLINDFLDLSRIEAGRLELVSSPVSLTGMAQKWRNEVSVLAEEKGLDFDIIVDPALPPMILSDEDALSKVAINLLGNAFKFTHHGQVLMQLSCMEDGWKMAVSDTGIGIPPHAREYIFEEFRQVDGSSKRLYGGTGLGLSLVQKLSRAMGGNVSLQSEVGKGSTFTVTLPLHVETIEEGVPV